MRSFSCAAATAVVAAIHLLGCASPTENAAASAAAESSEQVSLPTGTFVREDPPLFDSYYDSIAIKANGHATIVYVLHSTPDDRRFTYKSDSRQMFTDEGRHVLAFHVPAVDDDHSETYIDFELRKVSSTSLELSSVGDWRTFEMSKRPTP